MVSANVVSFEKAGEIIGVSRQRLYQLWRQGDTPEPLFMHESGSRKTPFWSVEQIEQWRDWRSDNIRKSPSKEN